MILNDVVLVLMWTSSLQHHCVVHTFTFCVCSILPVWLLNYVFRDELGSYVLVLSAMFALRLAHGGMGGVAVRLTQECVSILKNSQNGLSSRHLRWYLRWMLHRSQTARPEQEGNITTDLWLWLMMSPACVLGVGPQGLIESWLAPIVPPSLSLIDSKAIDSLIHWLMVKLTPLDKLCTLLYHKKILELLL